MALLDGALRQSSGILSGLTSGGGILATAAGPLQARLAALQAAATPQAKAQALMGTLGLRLKSGGILSAGGAGGGILSKLGSGGGILSKLGGGTGGAPTTDSAFQVAGGSRSYATPTPPSGIAYR